LRRAVTGLLRLQPLLLLAPADPLDRLPFACGILV
jgi:hypothetical protein